MNLDLSAIEIRTNAYLQRDMVVLSKKDKLVGWFRLVVGGWKWVPWYDGAKPEDANKISVHPDVLKSLKNLPVDK